VSTATRRAPAAAGSAPAARSGLPPGPRTPALVQTLRWARDPVGYLGALRRRYGDAFTVRFVGFGRWVYYADAETIAQIFQADPDALHAGEARDMLEPVVGSRSVLILDGDDHRRERRLLLPSFQGNHVRRYGDLMRDVVEEEIARWPLGRPFPLRPRMGDVTLEVILRAVFGFEAPARRAELHRRITRLLEVAAPVLLLPALTRDLGRWSPGGRLGRARAAVDELVYEQIRARRAEGAEHEDVLSLLLGARDEDGRALDDQAVRDELMTLLLAGHETTATGLAWAFERLVRHPAALERLVVELDAGEDGYLDAVIRETLRVRPVLFDTARKAVEDVDVGGWRLPAGTLVAPALALVHLDPALHPDPQAFRPERYADGSPPPRTWVPFGGGPRSCLGAGFALFEMRVVLRTVLGALRLRPARPEDERGKLRNVTVVPARGAEVIAARRGA
jgi:cytochrome P450